MSSVVDISSPSNAVIKHIKRLSGAAYRKKCGEFLLEGRRLVEDAVNLGTEVSCVVLSDAYDGPEIAVARTYRVPQALFCTLSETVSPQGILAVAKISEHRFSPAALCNANFAVYLDGIADPGNMGTIIRTCDAAGVDLLILSYDCVDLYNPKTVRSTMAGLCRLPIAVLREGECVFPALKSSGFCILAAALETETLYYGADFTKKTALIIGNEAHGIRKETRAWADQMIKIPILGGTESLNAAVACGVILYEAVRQKAKLVH